MFLGLLPLPVTSVTVTMTSECLHKDLHLLLRSGALQILDLPEPYKKDPVSGPPHKQENTTSQHFRENRTQKLPKHVLQKNPTKSLIG